MGWMGMKSELLFYLGVVNADKDAEGSFIITGRPIVVGLGEQEVVVPDETCYLVDGKPKALAAGLCGTSYGIKAKVF